MKKILVFISIFVLCFSNVVQVAKAASVSQNMQTEEEAPQETDDTGTGNSGETSEEEPAQTPAEQPTETEPEQPTETPAEQPEQTTAKIVIPDFTTKNYEEVRSEMESITAVSWILEYVYSEEEEDTIIQQDLSGEVELKEGLSVNLVISLGEQPEEALEETEELEDISLISAIGLGAMFGNPGLGCGNFAAWENIPFSYEYVYDNSNECWNWGVWYDGVCYTTPEGTYSDDVRHRISLYTDGVNVYCYIRFATCYGPGFNSEDLQFYVNGQMAAFQLTFPAGGTITGNVANLDPGVYPVEVKHRNSSLSYTKAEGSTAFINISSTGKNNEVEMMIPLETLKEQNPLIDLDRIDSLEFFSPNLMYRRVNCSGADTAPFVWAAVALVCVPTGVFVCRKKAMKKNR